VQVFGGAARSKEQVPEWVEDLVVRMKHMETELDTLHNKGSKKGTAAAVAASEQHLPTFSERLASGGALRIISHEEQAAGSASSSASSAASVWEENDYSNILNVGREASPPPRPPAHYEKHTRQDERAHEAERVDRVRAVRGGERHGLFRRAEQHLAVRA
jgi:hypothetical protein